MRGYRWHLAMILAFAAYVRLNHLFTPSLWWDEIIAIKASGLSFLQLLDWAAFHEVHAPLFHLVLQLLGPFASDPSWYRLVPAGFGILSTYVAYRTAAALFGARTGLFAAFIVATFPYAVVLSRVVRPYTIAIDLLFVCQALLLLYCESGRKKYLLWLAACNGILVLFQYIGFFVVFAQSICILFFSGFRGRDVLKRLQAFIAINFITCLPAAIFLACMLLYGDNKVHPYEFFAYLNMFGNNVKISLSTWPTVSWIFVLSTASGMAICYIRSAKRFVNLLLLAALPSLIIIILRLGPYFNPWHLFYLFPPATVFCALSLDFLAGRVGERAVFACIAGLLLVSGLAGVYEKAFLGSRSQLLWNNYDIDYKSFSADLDGKLGRGGFLFVADSMTKYGIDTYLLKKGVDRPVNWLLPKDDSLAIMVVGPDGLLPDNLREQLCGDQECVESYRGFQIIQKNIDRKPYIVVDALPYTTELLPSVVEALQRIFMMQGMELTSHKDFQLSPQHMRKPGVVEWCFAYNADKTVQQVMLSLSYLNAMESSKVTLEYAFDDEPFAKLFLSTGPDVQQVAQLPIYPACPFRSIRIRISVEPGTFPLGYYGPKLEMAGLRSLSVSFCGAGDIECSRQVIDTMPVGFDNPGALPQRIVSMDNIKQHEEDGRMVYSPSDPAHPGTMTVSVGYSSGSLHFFPRVHGKDASVVALREGQALWTFAGVDGRWSPVGGRCYLRNVAYGQQEQVLEFRLNGLGAQIWGDPGGLLAN